MRKTRWMSTVLLLLPAWCAASGDGFGAVSARDAQGREYELVALSSQVDYTIGGMVAQARIRQRFTHHGDGWIDATYQLPLPEGAAVTPGTSEPDTPSATVMSPPELGMPAMRVPIASPTAAVAARKGHVVRMQARYQRAAASKPRSVAALPLPGGAQPSGGTGCGGTGPT